MSDRQLREHHDRIVARNREARLAQLAEAQRQAADRNRAAAEKRNTR
ncbi:hypothetical protein [Micromonospora antibiotica]|uniref:Uncharacterized protein n=1 Tax=Micromonospora antibiotica TaxID=2807623 RepID=A0ABS3V119_9ACTN|nr:hypothetical protein [Micromonospora antibiotica]MBO4159307.1 hypothetical protein [Micromonospora antibiotica]